MPEAEEEQVEAEEATMKQSAFHVIIIRNLHSLAEDQQEKHEQTPHLEKVEEEKETK